MNKTKLGLLALLSMTSLSALAEAPLNTIEAEVQQPQACRFDAGYGRMRQEYKGYKSSSNLFLAGVGCGLTRPLEWDVNAYSLGADGYDVQGLVAGGKFRLLGQRGDASQLSLRAMTGYSRFSGMGDSETSWYGLGLALAFSQIVGTGHRIDVNLVTSTKAGHWDHPTWGVAYTHQLGAEWDLVGEIQGAVRSKPNQGLGARWKPIKDWEFGAMLTRHGVPDELNGSAYQLKATARYKY